MPRVLERERGVVSWETQLALDGDAAVVVEPEHYAFALGERVENHLAASEAVDRDLDRGGVGHDQGAAAIWEQ